MGYIGQSRSENSSNAIENFELPLSMINKGVLSDFEDELTYGSDGYEIDSKVFNLPLSIWKFGANKVGYSSWHHTGKYFNRTYHYDLYMVAEYLTEHYDTIRNDYKDYKAELKKEKEKALSHVELGYIEYQVWSGSRRHPKIVDYSSAWGYIKSTSKKDWLIDGYDRFDISANKVVKCKVTSDLKEFKKYMEKQGVKIDLRRFKKYLRGEGFKI